MQLYIHATFALSLSPLSHCALLCANSFDSLVCTSCFASTEEYQLFIAVCEHSALKKRVASESSFLCCLCLRVLSLSCSLLLSLSLLVSFSHCLTVSASFSRVLVFSHVSLLSRLFPFSPLTRSRLFTCPVLCWVRKRKVLVHNCLSS